MQIHNKLLYTLFIFLLILSIVPANSQSIQNIRVSQLDNKVLIKYDLESIDVNQGFDIGLTGLIGQSKYELIVIEGDIINVKPGEDKKILWNPNELFELYGRTIRLEPIIISPYLALSPNNIGIKRGDKKSITIKKNFAGNISLIKIDPSKEEIKINSLNTIEIPKNASVGKYKLVGTLGDENEEIVGGYVRVKRKFGWGLKGPLFILPLVATYFIVNKPQPSEDLPDPPFLPN